MSESKSEAGTSSPNVATITDGERVYGPERLKISCLERHGKKDGFYTERQAWSIFLSSCPKELHLIEVVASMGDELYKCGWDVKYWPIEDSKTVTDEQIYKALEYSKPHNCVIFRRKMRSDLCWSVEYLIDSCECLPEIKLSPDLLTAARLTVTDVTAAVYIRMEKMKLKPKGKKQVKKQGNARGNVTM